MVAPAAVMVPPSQSRIDTQSSHQPYVESSNVIKRYRQDQRLHAPRLHSQELTRDQRHATNSAHKKPPTSTSPCFSQEHFDAFVTQGLLFVRKREYPLDISQRRTLATRIAQSSEATVDRIMTILNWDGNLESTLTMPHMDHVLRSVKTLEYFFPATYPSEERDTRLAKLSKGIPLDCANLDSGSDEQENENDTATLMTVQPEQWVHFDGAFVDSQETSH